MVLAKGREEEVARVFDKWELEWSQIGTVTDSQRFEVFEGGTKVVDLPVGLLTSTAPTYDRPQKRPAYLDLLTLATIDPPEDLGQALCELLGSPNICSRREIFEQFDHMVGVGTVVLPGEGDAAVLRVPGTDRALAVSVDCNPRFCYLDPAQGAKLAVAECARNISCVGAKPLGTTDCLNFGDPTNPEIMWQFARAIDGMAEACKALDVPVVSGNVSLYNASNDVDIYPTPAVALVGAFEHPLEPQRGYCDMALKQADDVVILLGETDTDDLGGSEYLWQRTGQLGERPPAIDLEREAKVQSFVRDLIAHGFVRSAHDCSEGGLGVALAEKCVTSKKLLGIDLTGLEAGDRPDLTLFTESACRVIVSASPDDAEEVLLAAQEASVPATRLGVVTQTPRIVWQDMLDVPVGEALDCYASGLESLKG